MESERTAKLNTVAIVLGLSIAVRLLYETWRRTFSSSPHSGNKKASWPVVPGAYPLLGNPLGGIPNFVSRLRY